LPLGTANLLARDLRIPLDLDEAIAALSEMEPVTIDVGEVNDRVFLHKVVVGFAPAVAAGREHIRERTDLAALLGFLRYFRRQVMRPHHLRLVLEADEGSGEPIRVQSIAIANNAYDEGLGLLFSRSKLDGGHLTVYTARRLGVLDILRLSTRMALGSWRKDEALTERRVTTAVIHSRRKLLQVMVDGEVERMNTPLRFHIRPGALRVLAPAVQPETRQDDASTA
jgi:diacylglycerol kinase family enzyme